MADETKGPVVKAPVEPADKGKSVEEMKAKDKEVVKAAPESGPEYRIVGHGVGRFVRGDLVSLKDLGEGVDPERLLALGAIEKLKAD